MEQGINVQSRRKRYIRELAKAENASKRAKSMAEDLYALDLTVYSADYCFESIIYNALAVSEIDSSIALHPEQINIISQIKKQMDCCRLTPCNSHFAIYFYLIPAEACA